MKKCPTFSVLINNYNYAPYVGEAIKSVLDQTFCDFELIITDDGSSDASRDIIASFSDERIILDFKQNGGQASSFNSGFAKARGKYIAFLDSDDLFDSGKLEKLYSIFNNGEYSAVQHVLRVIDKNGKPDGNIFPGGLIYDTDDLLEAALKHNRSNLFGATSGIAAHRTVLRNILPIAEDKWRICADVPLTRPLAVIGKVRTLEQPLGSYRIHGSNFWMNTPERAMKSAEMQAKSDNCINSFIRRWGLQGSVGKPFPYEPLLNRRIKNIALYGAGRHTLALLGIGLQYGIKVSAILDDSPQAESLAGIPIVKADEFAPASCDAVVISSDIHEEAMVRKALQYGWENIFTIYSIKSFAQDKRTGITAAVGRMRQNNVRSIALYGAGLHTINLIASGRIPSDIRIECIFDDFNYGKKLLGISVVNPIEYNSFAFDAVLISSDKDERKIFSQLISKGFENIYCIYGPETAIKGYYADLRDIRNAFYNVKEPKAAFYGVSYYNECLIQSEILKSDLTFTAIVDDEHRGTKKLNGLPILNPNTDSLADIGTLIIPPSRDGVQTEERFKSMGIKNILRLTENINEIDLIFSFMNKFEKGKGIMIDVGANTGSSLIPFAEAGWDITAFEPERLMRSRLKETCRSFTNVRIEDLALSDKPAKSVPIYNSSVSIGISTLSPFHASHRASGFTDITTLKLYTEEYGIKKTDFLKIDTEGYDLFVLKGNDWNNHRPKLIMCEFEDRKTLKLGYSFYDMADFLMAEGYSLLISEMEPVFEYGRQPRWKRFTGYPSNLLDNEAAGNILAFESSELMKNFLIFHGISLQES